MDSSSKILLIEFLYSILCIFIPCIVYQIIASKLHLKDGKEISIRHFVWVYIFIFYIYLAFSKAGIGSVWDIGQYSEIIRINEINLIPFSSDGIITYILNIIMFMPLGFLLPFIWEKFRSINNILCTGLGFSLAIEFCQLFNHRATDIDDLMMNTLGAILGYLIWVCVSYLFNSISKNTVFISKDINPIENELDNDINKKTICLSKNEPIIYLALATLGQFFLYNWTIIPY